MGLILLFIIAALAVIIPITIYDRNRQKDNESLASNYGNALFASIVSLIVIVIVVAVTWGHSYDSYVDTRTFYNATREQYAGAVTVFKDHAVIDMGVAAFTDFKYQGYQEHVAKLVIDLRNSIIEYNKMFVSKRVMGQNWFFSWLIIEPDDDMKIIKMKAPMAGMVE
jgi:hypothetical protein